MGQVCFERVLTITKDLKKIGSFLLTKISIHIKIVIWFIKHTNVCLHDVNWVGNIDYYWYTSFLKKLGNKIINWNRRWPLLLHVINNNSKCGRFPSGNVSDVAFIIFWKHWSSKDETRCHIWWQKRSYIKAPNMTHPRACQMVWWL